MSAPAPIVIVAPCPLGKGAVEGWMSRIRAIDAVFAGQRRVYLDMVSGGAAPGRPQEILHGEAREARIDMLDPDHRAYVEALIAEARFVYVHTVHLARFVLPYYITGKIVTDIHGVVPEEERMLGRPEHGDFYEAVEASVVLSSPLLVVVSAAMRAHLMAKYPACQAEFVIAPIIESHAVDLADRKPRAEGAPYRVLYSGGAQVWQNIDATLAAWAEAKDICTFEALSHDHEIIRAKAEALGLGAGAARFRVVDKPALAEAYLNSDFGFVLRDDSPVNFVACPTKLSEYLWFGVIPVVKTAMIGDFAAEGYKYLTLEEFSIGLLPDEAALARMRAKNRDVIQRLGGQFSTAAQRLAGLTLESRINGASMAGLPVGDRHLVFPNQAEAYLFADGMAYQSRPVAGPYGAIELRFPEPTPATSARIVPLLADMRVRLSGITFVLAEGETPPGVSAYCPGALARSAGGDPVLCLAKSAPHLDLQFDRRVMVEAVRFEAVFEALGVKTPLKSGQDGHGLAAAIRFETPAGAARVSTAPLAAAA